MKEKILLDDDQVQATAGSERLAVTVDFGRPKRDQKATSDRVEW